MAALIGAALAFGALAPSGATGATGCEYDGSWPAPDSAMAETATKLVNLHRAGLGLASVAPSPVLTRAARWKAGHMSAGSYLEHEDAGSSTRSPEQRLSACGYSEAMWSENIAAGQTSAEAVVAGWLASPGHRANIEDPSFNAIGMGAVTGPDGRVYWAQIFGEATPEPVIAPPPVAAPAPVAPKKTATPAKKGTVGSTPQTATARPIVRVRRAGKVRPGRSRGVGLRMRTASKLAVGVRLRGRRGARLVLRCGTRVRARVSAGRRKRVVLRAKGVRAARCRVTIKAPRRGATRFRLTAVAR